MSNRSDGSGWEGLLPAPSTIGMLEGEVLRPGRRPFTGSHADSEVGVPKGARGANSLPRTLRIAGGVLVGTAVAVYVWRVVQRRRLPKAQVIPQRRSLWGELSRAAAIALASAAGRRLAEKWIQAQNLRALHPKPESKSVGSAFGERSVARREIERLRALYF